MPTLGEMLVRWLEAHGVTHVFGIPGVHTVELYRGLAGSGIRHVTARHEQGAGFMADGYARVTGRPGVAFVITGPGLTNILTPMAQAHADSQPMLVVSSVNRRRMLGLGHGDLHEVHRQGALAEHAAAFSHTLTDPAQLPEVLARAWAVFEGARPRPVHIEVPLDMLGEEVADTAPARAAPLARPVPPAAAIAAAAEMLDRAERPLLIAGGGAVRAGTELHALAEAIGAPVVMTTNGRGLLPPDHPLAVPASPSLDAVRAMIAASDGLLAVGTELGRTDYDMYDRGLPAFPESFARIEIDPKQMRRGPLAGRPLLGDAGPTLALIAAACRRTPSAGGAGRAAAVREAALEEVGARYRRMTGFLEVVRDALPDAPIVCDSTQAAYAGNLFFAAGGPARWFNAATGYGALGYGLPAAVGAAVATGGPVVCITGDGGLQFTLAELGAAVEQGLPLILLVWDNKGYGEIKSYMAERGVAPLGVDLLTPDFEMIARAYGAEALRLEDLSALPGMLADAAARPRPTVIVFDEAVVVG
ncbi:MAG TPA: 5-guanidino-2-oxopentanoate decarboxylase [Thermohalobaculum sp.]|nr:5-guanidino-2-oxopentanoate decarboxylase [Thermohalobaculum sp.]